MKHVCVAARIGDGKAPVKAIVVLLPRRATRRRVEGGAGSKRFMLGCDTAARKEAHLTSRFTHPFAVASPQAGPLLHAAVRRRFWLQPFGLARVLAYNIVA